MNDDCYVARSPMVAARMIGSEVMIMSGADSSLFSLNETASLLWEAADGVTPLANIVRERICSQFDVDPETALRDAHELAQQLAAYGILRVAAAPIRNEPEAGE